MPLSGGEIIIKKYMIILFLYYQAYRMMNCMVKLEVLKENTRKHLITKMLFFGPLAAKIIKKQTGGQKLRTQM